MPAATLPNSLVKGLGDSTGSEFVKYVKGHAYTVGEHAPGWYKDLRWSGLYWILEGGVVGVIVNR